jgi:hypothetical protein
MDDLISRAALLKECAECQKTDPRFEERGWASHFLNAAGEPSTEWYCVEDMIENAPTIDAIPVEWLNKQCEMADDRGDMEMTDAISWLIQTWQEKQEAQDG